MNLKSKLFLRIAVGLIIIVALLFIAASSLKFWQGWAYLALVLIPSMFAFLHFYKHDP